MAPLDVVEFDEVFVSAALHLGGFGFSMVSQVTDDNAAVFPGADRRGGWIRRFDIDAGALRRALRERHDHVSFEEWIVGVTREPLRPPPESRWWQLVRDPDFEYLTEHLESVNCASAFAPELGKLVIVTRPFPDLEHWRVRLTADSG